MTTEELLEFLWQQAVSVGYDKGREAFDSMESESIEELKAKLRAAEDGQARVQNAAVDLAEKLRAAEEERDALKEAGLKALTWQMCRHTTCPGCAENAETLRRLCAEIETVGGG